MTGVKYWVFLSEHTPISILEDTSPYSARVEARVRHGSEWRSVLSFVPVFVC